jgi:hypothetical protein
MIRMGAMVLAVTVATMPAMASDAPSLRPQRDAAITYRMTSDGEDPGAPRTRTVQVNVTGKGALVRIDPGGDRGYLIVDHDAHHMTMVMPARRSVMEVPYDPTAGLLGRLQDSEFVRRGTARFIGFACTEYDVSGTRGHGTICVTDDGVLLHAKGVSPEGRNGEIAATELRYGDQPAALFQPPAGFKRLERPGAGQQPQR